MNNREILLVLAYTRSIIYIILALYETNFKRRSLGNVILINIDDSVLLKSFWKRLEKVYVTITNTKRLVFSVDIQRQPTHWLNMSS